MTLLTVSKHTAMMIFRQVIVGSLLMASCVLQAKPLAWYDGKHVSYAMQKKYGTVVEKAAEMFDGDMLAVTGRKAHRSDDATVMVFQLDMASNKEMSLLDKYDVPYLRVITRQDAFWMGVRRGKLFVVGSNGRGTAYGLLELSRMAGVSPWIYWGDVRPERRQRLTVDDRFETLQSPSVEYRGLSLAHVDWSSSVWAARKMDTHLHGGALGPHYYHKLLELLLRLRGNLIWPAATSGSGTFTHVKGNQEVADSFEVFLGRSADSPIYHRPGGHKAGRRHDRVTSMISDDGYGYLADAAGSGGEGSGVLYRLSYAGSPHDHLWLSTLQPGLLVSEMARAYHQRARRLWVAEVHDPKVAAYQLSLFMDMAWQISSVRTDNVQQHLRQWLIQQWGDVVGERLVQPMTEFYHLCGIRKPEFMGWSQVGLDAKRYDRGWSAVQNTEWSADEFGNELERYLADYDRLKQEVAAIEKLLRPEQQDAFFAAVAYPVRAAAAMATKQLQAQEARLIGKPRSFHRDEEALESAVRSWNAYTEIQQLTRHYNKVMAGGKWDGLMSMAPRGLNVFQEPTFPGKLTDEVISRYARTSPVPSKLDTDGAVVYNACNYSAATEGAQTLQMMGHSMKPVALQAGASLTYRFYARGGDAALYTALIPMQAGEGKDLRYQVSIDGGTPQVFSLKVPVGSEQWKTQVLRGQAIRSTPVRLTTGTHTLVITAIDDRVVVDQWMIDYDTDRQFYMMPVRSAM